MCLHYLDHQLFGRSNELIRTYLACSCHLIARCTNPRAFSCAPTCAAVGFSHIFQCAVDMLPSARPSWFPTGCTVVFPTHLQLFAVYLVKMLNATSGMRDFLHFTCLSQSQTQPAKCSWYNGAIKIIDPLTTGEGFQTSGLSFLICSKTTHFLD